MMLPCSNPAFSLRSTGVLALLLGSLMLPYQAQAAVEIERTDASGYDAVLASHGDTGSGYTLRNSRFTVDDLQKLREQQKRSADELDDLKKIIKEQARTIDELKRGGGSSSSSGSGELSALKRKVEEQDRTLDKFGRTVDDLKRNSGSGSSSSELSGLKRDVSDQGRELDKLRSKVDDLSRKVK